MKSRRHFTSDRLKALIRFDITWTEFWGEEGFTVDFTADRYKPDLDDVAALLGNIQRRKPSLEELFKEWSVLFQRDVLTPPLLLSDGEDPGPVLVIRSFYDLKGNYSYEIEDADTAVLMLLNSLEELSWKYEGPDEDACSGVIDFERMLRDIEAFRENDFSHINYGWKWNDVLKIAGYNATFENGFGPLITEDEYPEAADVINEMCDRKIAKALDIRAYQAYGGGELFPCDWVLSRDSLLELMDMPDVDDMKKGYYANTLGYIYYYGRCTGGVPDYESALKYYMVGGACGIYESIYKISDMLRGGKGVPENITAADNIISWSYQKVRSAFLENEDPSKFPDLALRMSSIEKEKGNFIEAYTLLLEADYVMQNRLQYGYYGDDKVALSIRKGLSELKRSHGKEISEYNDNNLVFKPISDLIDTATPVRGELFKGENGEFRILFICHYKSPSIFVELAAADLVMVTKSVIYELSDLKKFHVRQNSDKFLFDSFSYERTPEGESHLVFTRDERVTAEFDSGDISVLFPIESEEDATTTVHQFASCSFTEDGRTYDYLADGMEVRIGDTAIVDSWDGEAEVYVSDVFDMAEDELPIPLERYKWLKRIL